MQTQPARLSHLSPKRAGDWMLTFTGRRFWPRDPRADEIDVRDIAHALSLICRYGGHVARFYSVAEHCCLLAQHFVDKFGPGELARWALIHDGAEAYIGDMIRPLKPSMAQFQKVEGRIDKMIAARFGLRGPFPIEVKAADTAILGDEAQQLFSPAALAIDDWWRSCGPLGVTIGGWKPARAEQRFLELFDSLFPGMRG